MPDHDDALIDRLARVHHERWAASTRDGNPPFSWALLTATSKTHRREAITGVLDALASEGLLAGPLDAASRWGGPALVATVADSIRTARERTSEPDDEAAAIAAIAALIRVGRFVTTPASTQPSVPRQGKPITPMETQP